MEALPFSLWLLCLYQKFQSAKLLVFGKVQYIKLSFVAYALSKNSLHILKVIKCPPPFSSGSFIVSTFGSTIHFWVKFCIRYKVWIQVLFLIFVLWAFCKWTHNCYSCLLKRLPFIELPLQPLLNSLVHIWVCSWSLFGCTDLYL